MSNAASSLSVLDGRFDVERELGRGGMGRVVLVSDRYDAGAVPRAAKLLESPGLHARFMAEVALLRRICHPSFVAAGAMGYDPALGAPYVLLEACLGSDLTQPAPDSREPADVLAALLRAVDHLHCLGWAHGDLAPSNVLWSTEAETTPIKILDLGAAGKLGTGEGSTSGVLQFVAPERLSGGALTRASDLWSLGALVFQLIHGVHPFPDYPGRPPAAAPQRRGLSNHPLDPILDRLLEVAPSDRYPTAAAALAELESTLAAPRPLVTREELLARAGAAPFVDAGRRLDTTVTAVRWALSRSAPYTLAVEGPAGSGRSRFVQALLDALVSDGARVVLERPLPGDAAGDLLERALHRLGDTNAKLDPERPAAAVQELLGLTRRTGLGPTALIVDDIDRADAYSRDVLAALMRSAQSLPDRVGPLVLVTTSVSPRGAKIDDAVPSLNLEPWSEQEMEQLLKDLFPERRVGSRVSGPLAKETRGNPGIAAAVLRAMASHEALTVDAAAVHLAADRMSKLTLPHSVEEAAASSLQGLGASARRDAALVAWSGAPVPQSQVASAAELTAAGVSLGRNVGDMGVSITLASPALARAAREFVSETEAHSALAGLWAGVQGPGGTALRLHHALQAGDHDVMTEAANLLGGDVDNDHASLVLQPLVGAGWPTGATDALLGGDIAARIGDVELAGVLYERAAGQADAALAARALCRMGELEARQARHANAMDVLRRALERGGPDLKGESRAEILAGLSRSAVLSGATDDAEMWAAEGLALAGSNRALRGRLAYTRGLVAWYRGDMDAAEGLLDMAHKDVQHAGDAVEEGAVVTAMGLVAHRRALLDEALNHYKAALRIGERAGDEARVLTALQNLGVVHHEKGDWMRALDTYREAMELAEALDQPGRVVQLSGNIGNLWRYLGELDLAKAVLDRGLSLARREDNRYMVAIILTMLGEVATAREEWGQAETLLTEAASLANESQSATEEVEAWLNLARLHLETQNYVRAREAASQARSIAEGIDAGGLRASAAALEGAAELRSVHGDSEVGQAHIDDALAALDTVTNPDGKWPIVLEGMWAAAARGDGDQARELAEEVRQLLRGLEDGAPAKHRGPFRRLRDRRRAALLTALVLDTGGKVEAAASSRGATAGPAAASSHWERLLEINKRLNLEYDVKRLLEYIMDSAILLTGAERGFLLLEDAATDREALEIKVARNIDQENIRNVRLKISHSIARRVIESGEAALTIDAMEDDRYAQQLSVHDLKLRSVLCLPMRSSGKVLGAIYLDNRFQRAAFGDSDLRFMEAFADQAAIALSNAQLVQAMEQQTKQLEKAQVEVKKLNEKLAGELKAKAEELENTHKVVIRQQRQLEQKHTYQSIIGTSDRIRQVFAVMDRLLDNAIPVLIEGESGTGKELVARAIHYNGARRDRAFVAVNCGAIPANLLESELFGHVRGAFTGATHDKKGLFEAAHGGTLLLDELGELPLEMQVKLLRVLQNGEIKKVGSTRDIKVDVRIVAATNRRLEEEVAGGRFREDLYYRLSVVPIQLPPLRDRADDIPQLVQHFISKNQQSGLGSVTAISAQALTLLKRYDWPGNVRQLEMVLKNASLFAEGDTLQPRDFESFPDIVSSPRASIGKASLSGKSLAEIEREAIIAALQDNRGNKKRSAEQLGIDRRTLYNKLKAYNIMIQKELTVS